MAVVLLGVVDRDHGPAVALAAVQGRVGLGRELEPRLAEFGAGGHAGRERDRVAVVAPRTVLETAGQEAPREDDRTGRVGMRHEEGELVAADAEGRIRGSDRGADQLSDLGQELVAHGVTLRVVDALELVDVDEHEREVRAVAARALDHARHRLLEGAVVAEAGEAVPERGLAGALIQLAEA